MMNFTADNKILTHALRSNRSYIQNDKENNYQIPNTQDNSSANKNGNVFQSKGTRNLISQKSIPTISSIEQKNTSLVEITNNYTLQHCKTEENLKEMVKKVNADKVKCSLNYEKVEMDKDELQTIENLKKSFKEYYSLIDHPKEQKDQIHISNNVLHPVQYQSQVNQLSVCTQKIDNSEWNSTRDSFAQTKKLNNAINPQPTVPAVISSSISNGVTNTQNLSSTSQTQAINSQTLVATIKPQPTILSPKDQENQNLIKYYSNQILSYMKQKEKETTPINSLIKHNIPSNLRAKMVDWMIEVLSSYKCTEQTFFLSVRIMDQFFQKTTKVNEISDLHLVGVTAMFIAGKFEEIYPMKLQIVHEKIAHKKLTIDAIKKKECEILHTLNFNIIGATPFDFVTHAITKMNLKETLDKKVFNYLEKICIYLAKMVLYDYELISSKDYAILSGSLIFVAFKIIEQIDKNFKAEDKIKDISTVLTLNPDILIEIAAKILNLAKSFDKLYPNLENLKKYNGFTLEESDIKQQ